VLFCVFATSQLVPRVFDEMAGNITKNIALYNGLELCTIAWSYYYVSRANPVLFATIANRLAHPDIRMTLSPSDVALVTWSFTSLNCASTRFLFHELTPVIRSTLPAMSLEEVAKLAQGFSTVRRGRAYVLRYWLMYVVCF
jgi:nicotinamide riboside kinase